MPAFLAHTLLFSSLLSLSFRKAALPASGERGRKEGKKEEGRKEGGGYRLWRNEEAEEVWQEKGHINKAATKRGGRSSYHN